MMISFKCNGHPNILATHKNTYEFTREKHLTEQGDCMVGVRADYLIDEVIKLPSEARVRLIILDEGEVVFEDFFIVNGDFCDRNEIVIRKSSFVSDRTLGVESHKAAIDLPRSFVKKIQDHEAVFTVKIEVVP